MAQIIDFDQFLKEIQVDTTLVGEKIIVQLDRECDCMLKAACHLAADGTMQNVEWSTSFDGDQADSAEIFLEENGDAVVSFHETRPSRHDHRPNGIHLHHDELDVSFVVFLNVGDEALTVDGEWIQPGKYTVVRRPNMNFSIPMP